MSEGAGDATHPAGGGLRGGHVADPVGALCVYLLIGAESTASAMGSDQG